MRLRVFVVFVLAVVFGCSSQPFQVAQVSGRVTLDGKPLPKASVTFAPMASKDNQAPGPTAAGLTDADGRYKVEDVSRTRSTASVSAIVAQQVPAYEMNCDLPWGNPLSK